MKQARTLLLRGSAALSALLALSLPRAAQAQADLTVPLTNALLLVDTSGSMEYKTDGTLPICNPASTASVNEKSRWTDVIEVLTGTIDDYTCQAIDRTDNTAGFKTGEYQLGGTPPYDFLYPLAYHRPLSNGCAPAPGVQSSNPFIYPASGAISYHKYNSTTACTFSQHGNDGVLDAWRSITRFGLMTFDTSIDKGTGYSGTMASASVNATTGKAGLWSYVPNGVATGKPAGCSISAPAQDPPDQEVGARNAAAPPWEGRMVNFGNPYDGVRAYETKNTRIQEILLATRPYGATPIAGMLQDASDFLLVDASKDPDRIPATLLDSDVASDFGPRMDPYVACSRKQIVILLTDGQPNLDLRPYCASTAETPAGKCPFSQPEDITAALNTPLGSPKAIKTYVIGYALDKVDHDNNPATPTFDCTTMTSTHVARNTTSLCGNPANAGNAALQACCSLQRIAIAGGTTAFFGATSADLRKYFSKILGNNLAVTSRTQAVASTGTGASTSSSGGGFQFFSGFQPTSGEAWRGTLERRRIVCDDPAHLGIPTPQPIDEDLGDDFERNLAVGGPDARRIYTVLGGALVSDPLYPSNTIRPLFGTSDKDGVGTYGGRYFSGNSRYFIDNLPTTASAIPTPSCINQAGNAITAAACQKQYLDWWAGYDNGQTLVVQRCPDEANCHLLGDIMHSTPVVVDRPIASIRDESYTRFTEVQKLRPKVLYTSTNDGILHAFKVASNDPAEKNDQTKKVLTDGASNELWAFVPPAVLPNLYHLYPATHQVLLDGVPVVRDVVAVPSTQADKAPSVFERPRTAAQNGSSQWRTVLVQGFGAEQTGYFAVDVTNPIPSTSDPNDVNKGGARMLWQLTTDKANGKLFGRGGVTPTITTLYFDPAGGTDVREIPVAILPGGPGGTQVTSGTGCPATARTFTDVTLDSAYPPRGKVHCYDFSDGNVGARSLTIVRLDTGEIVRTFRQNKTEVHVSLQPRVTEVGIDSPITGQPVAFPSSTGEVADRIFVGDDDGRLWRVNVASTKPADWTMKLFMDLYPTSFGASPGMTFADGQPISIPPVLSVDLENNLVINVATGNQDALGAAPGQTNFVYSLTEKINTAHTGYSTKVNWYTKFTNGTRVVGPMVLFNGGLYFGTYAPAASGQVCSVGVSEIWGVNYLVPQNNLNLAAGGQVLTGFSGQVIQSVSSAVAFGPSVVQTPSCATVDDIPLGDGILGYGHRMGLSNIQTGGFQLVFQTGSNRTSTAVSDAAVGIRTIDLPAPPALSTISAWANIVE